MTAAVRRHDGFQIVRLTVDTRGAEVQNRVAHLQRLSCQVVEQYLVLAETLYVEHDVGLWQRARTVDGDHYRSEEAFWEEALGIKRRMGFQLVAIGRMLSTLCLPGADRAVLSSVGLHKMDILVPVLERQTTVSDARRWIAIAQTHSREALREQVRHVLGRTARSPDADQRLQQYVVNAMPDLDSRDLATTFFAVGTTYVGSHNTTAILIAAMQEALSTWTAHLGDGVDDQGDASIPR